MSRADWSDAPEWANWWAVDEDGEAFWYENKPIAGRFEWLLALDGDHTYAGEGDPTNWRESLERRPEEEANLVWCECGDGYEEDSDSALFIEKMGECENCAAADGEAELDADNINHPDPQLSKQVRYRDSEGEDWIDEFARTATPEEFRGAMRFTIGKYNRRMGRKDAELAEVRKMRDYCQRWEQYLMHNEGEEK